jgi:hypothetical protein
MTDNPVNTAPETRAALDTRWDALEPFRFDLERIGMTGGMVTSRNDCTLVSAICSLAYSEIVLRMHQKGTLLPFES